MAGITKEQILESIRRLEAEGKTPTMQGIRRLIGGSYSTLGPILSEWKQQQAQSLASELSEESPVPIPLDEKASEFARVCWRIAEKMAKERIETERKELQKIRRKLEAERNEAIVFADDVSSENESLRSELEEKKKELEAEHKKTRESENLTYPSLCREGEV